MAKNLVVCCDGTWNDPDELRGDVSEPTNVAKLALALDSNLEVSPGAQAQLVHYVPGVGTAPGDHLLGGAFGVGISQNIRDGYRFLVENYDPDDRVFLFGFSRGAYTARSLGGLIHNCGILRHDCIEHLDAAYAFYRDRTNKTHPRAIAAQIFRRDYSHQESKVYFIGVWDTVGALGIPHGLPGWEHLSKDWPGWEQLWGFHDTRLSPDVRYAYQALAIDEERPPYAPTLWTGDPPPPEKQTLEQVWFAGVHSEVGGGTADPSLSDIALTWLAAQAEAAGARFCPTWRQTLPCGVQPPAPNYAGRLNQSRHGVWELLHPLHRLLSPKLDAAPNQAIASSAQRRATEQIDGYKPRGLNEYLNSHPTAQTEEQG